MIRSLTTTAFLLAFAITGAGVLAQEAPESTTVALKNAVRNEALPLIAGSNYEGLGPEAQKVATWLLNRPLPIFLDPAAAVITDAASARLSLSRALSLALSRVNQWYGLAATEDNPITHAELRAGTLRPESVLQIRGLFEESVRRAVRVEGRFVVPEAGGEAVLDGDLRLVESRDPRWKTIQDLAKLTEPEAVSRFYNSHVLDVARVDRHGLLGVALARLRLGHITAPAEVERAVATVVRNAAPTYSLTPESQFALIASRDWRGRYVGRFHTHAPRDQNGEWVAGDLPSFEDMQNAIEAGQYLTLSFDPDGFDLYDASALGDADRIDLTLLKVIRYRSATWRTHFQSVVPDAKTK